MGNHNLRTRRRERYHKNLPSAHVRLHLGVTAPTAVLM